MHFLLCVVSCLVTCIYAVRFRQGILCEVRVMFSSMRGEELLKHFSKDFLRRRELKKSADEKKRGGGKKREEGLLVCSSASTPSF